MKNLILFLLLLLPCTSQAGQIGGTLASPSPSYTATAPITSSGNTGAFGYGALTYSDTNTFGAFQTSVNGYAQWILQNSFTGSAASADYIVSNDIGTATTYYGDFGINSSGYTGSGSFNLPNAVYLQSTSGEMVIGTATNNGIHFIVNNGVTDALAISGAGAISTANTFTTTSASGSAISAVSGTVKGVFLNASSQLQLNGTMIVSNTAPTIASGFGTAPSVAYSRGTSNFGINVGTGGTASGGLLTMPAATAGWTLAAGAVSANTAGCVTSAVSTSATSVTVSNIILSTGAACPWPASAVISFIAMAY